MKILLVVLVLIVGGIILTAFAGRSAWKQYVAEKLSSIKSVVIEKKQYVDLEKETQGLPLSVKRYFYLVLQNGAPIINKASVTQAGGFRVKPEMKEWSQMNAEQVFSTNPRGMIWDARISIVSGINIAVCDSYVSGRGEMKGGLLAAFPFFYQSNKKELDEGALLRFLAESVWFPTALLPSQGVVWKEIDPLRAEATISDSGISVSLEFQFNKRGEIISAFTPARYREVSGEYVATPWKGYYANYSKYKSYWIPKEAKVEWHLEDQVYSYWKAALIDVQYE